MASFSLWHPLWFFYTVFLLSCPLQCQDDGWTLLLFAETLVDQAQVKMLNPVIYRYRDGDSLVSAAQLVGTPS